MRHSFVELLRVAASHAENGELPVWRQLAEMSYLMLRHRLGPGYYMMARFWRRSVPFSEKCRHWNGRRYLREVHRINDPRYYKISQNKLVEKSLLTALGIPTPRLIGLFEPASGQGCDGQPLRTATDLERILRTEKGRRLFFKPAEGDSGRGVFAVDVLDGEGELQLRRPFTDEVWTVARLIDALKKHWMGTVIELGIEQHPELSRLNPSSVNTLRMWVIDDGGVGRVVGAFLRIGRAGSEVDNTSQGGLACPVDLETGLIREALDLTMHRRAHQTHPDSGAMIPGSAIPHWPACISLSTEALRVLPGARFAGLDIAVTESGPLVVEYNVEPDQRGAAHMDLPHGQALSGLAAHE